MNKTKEILDVAGTWLLILIISGLIVWVAWEIATLERTPQPPPVKQIQSWTITAPDGKVWRAVKNE